MRIFVDTNIFLDIVFRREEVSAAKRIFTLIESGLFSAYVADITLINIAYIASKQNVDVKSFLHYITRRFTVLGADNSVFEEALQLDNHDFEDNVQLILALKAQCQIIITNDKTFIKEKTDVISSMKFVENYCL